MISMKPNALLEDFKNQLLKAINAYQQSQKSIPTHRSQDIAALKQAIQENEVQETTQEHERLKKKILSILDDFKTGIQIFGWWIYETGHSKLKIEIEKVLHHPDYSEVAFLEARNAELSEQVQIMTTFQDLDVAEETDIHPLEVILRQAQQIIFKLRQKNHALCDTIQSHEQTIHVLQKANKTLRKQNHALYDQVQKSQRNSQEVTESDLAGSPSEYMCSSFKNYTPYFKL